jgi:hypothetical protein
MRMVQLPAGPAEARFRAAALSSGTRRVSLATPAASPRAGLAVALLPARRRNLVDQPN